jgi:ribosome biogenesis GTPase A
LDTKRAHLCDQAVGLRLALIGSINDNIINTTELSLDLILFLSKHYREALKNRYEIELTEVLSGHKEASKVLEQIAFKRSSLLKGGEPDIDKAANMLMDDFRNIKLGNITLEFPDSVPQ